MSNDLKPHEYFIFEVPEIPMSQYRFKPLKPLTNVKHVIYKIRTEKSLKMIQMIC